MNIESGLDICQINEVHAEAVATVAKAMPPADVVQDMAELFKIMGDPTRMGILQALALSELCVCDLAALLELSQSAISHQLRVLRTAKLVRFRRDGKMVFYNLDDDHIHTLMRVGREHVREG